VKTRSEREPSGAGSGAPEISSQPTDNQRPGQVLSIVIPVYNSADLIGATIDEVVGYCDEQDLSFQLLLINDGSTDGSWKVLADRAQQDQRITSIDLLRNYGQHTAVFAGLTLSSGDLVITMDDDLQNPATEIGTLIVKAQEGHDLVVGRYRQKHHAPYRRLGSRLIGGLNRRIFGKPKDFVIGNFRCMRRDLVDRIVAYSNPYPYITGLAIMFASRPINVDVEHRPRPGGSSNYGIRAITALVFRILFNYSSFPLRLVSVIGLIATVTSFVTGSFFLVRALAGGSSVPGFTTLIVLLSFFNGVSLLILSMLGEYTIRLLRQSSQPDPYHIRETVGPRD